MEQAQLSHKQPLPNDELILISPPCLKLDFDKNDYPWHLEINIECQLNFWNCERLCEEFKIQDKIDKALYQYISSICTVKQIMVCHNGNQNIHHWYLSTDQVKFSMDKLIAFDNILSKRSIHFELTRDENWDYTIPTLDRLKHKVLGLFSVLDRLKGNNYQA